MSRNAFVSLSVCTYIAHIIAIESSFDVYTTYLVHGTYLKTGFTFFYWEYYKTKPKEYDHSGWFLHRNDYNGYTEQDLYIAQKYADIKEELLSNAIFQMTPNQYESSMNKATKLMTSKLAKKMKSQDHGTSLHYDIPDGALLTIQHLLAVILYTDWSDLSREFTATFRKKQSYESLSSIKRRNREFANWSKLLREAVQLYGAEGFEGDLNDKVDIRWNKKRNRQVGPFFCGMSAVLKGMSFKITYIRLTVCYLVPELNIKLCGPTSTSTSRQAAMTFAGNNGMLLKLDYSYEFDNHYCVRSFDCVGFSNFVHESECLFMGGHHTIRIVDILNMKTNQSYSEILEPLYYFDSIVKGQLFNEDEENQIASQKALKYKALLKQLIKCKLKRKAYKEAYINDTFECMTNHKTEIIINLETLIASKEHGPQLSEFRDLLVDSKNVIKPVIFDLFQNCKRLLIFATDTYGEPYKFNWSSFKSVLDSKADYIKSKGIKVIIIGKWNYFNGAQSWVGKSFGSHQMLLNSNGFYATLEKKLTFFHTSAFTKRYEDQLVITMHKQ